MKIKISADIIFYKFLILVFAFAFYTTTFAQSAATSSAVKWEDYSVKNFKVSFLLPKLPVVVNETSRCRGEETFAYGSYAAGATYVVRMTRKIDVPRTCTEKEEFDKNRFNERVSALKNTLLDLKERANGKSNEIVLDGKNIIHKLINDSKNDQWFEFQVIGADETKTEVKNFLGSLKINKLDGIEIGSGAAQTLSDQLAQTPDNGVKNSVKPENSKLEGVMIALKPRANYTDLTRKNNTQGKVVLRVVFSANGGIGAISVISGIADGLTEQSIAAARRIVFVPARRNGVAYSVAKLVEYSFTIY